MRSAFSLRDNLRRLLLRPDGNLGAVDGVRAWSILWVVLMHAAMKPGIQFAPGPLAPLLHSFSRGYLGVSMFFVLSGFLIARLLLRQLVATGTLHLRDFYRRRALRILPAYYLVLILYCAIEGSPCGTVWANLLFINNFIPWRSQCMSWSWSLAIEEQFYLLFPLGLLLLFRLRRGRAAVLLIAIAATSLIRGWIIWRHGWHLLDIDYTDDGVADALYTKPYTRAGELLCGVLLAYR